MDRERMRRSLEVVAAYRASGQKSKAWAAANDVPQRMLASWCAHSRRWQARLDLHWPLGHTRELAALVRELAR